jgi:hypothetical protein
LNILKVKVADRELLYCIVHCRYLKMVLANQCDRTHP